MDNSGSSGDEVWCVDSETGKQYIMNLKTGQIVREVKPNEGV